MGSYVFQPRGKGFAFRIAVPQDLRDRFKSPRIIEGLGTDSAAEAHRLAAKRRAHWLDVFERARRAVPLTLGEIQAEAAEAFRLTLARMASEAAIWADIIGSEESWLRSNLELRERALAASDFSTLQPDIEAVERRKGIALSGTHANDSARETLARALLRAQIAAITGRLKALKGQPSEEPENFLGPEGIDQLTLRPAKLAAPIIRLRTERGPWALFEQWIERTGPAPATVNRWRAVFLAMQAKFKDREISEDEGGEWANGLVNAQRTARTVSDIWLSAARSVYAWAYEQRPRLVPGNPFANVRVSVPEQPVTRYKRFSLEEVTTILKAALAIEPEGKAFKAAQRWCPWLAAYSGARMGELTQLRGQDVLQVDGIWVMRLTPDAGTTKTRMFRDVPLHPHIIEMGFLDFLKAHGDGPLFYNPNGGRRSKGEATNPARPRAVKTRERLAAWVRELGVTDKSISPTHAWRHTFKSIAAGKDARMPDRISDAITGHAPATVAGRYEHPDVADMAAALGKYPRYRV